MNYYKVKVTVIDLGRSKIIKYGNEEGGFPARVHFDESVEYGVCATNIDLDEDDKVIKISKEEFESIITEINSIVSTKEDSVNKIDKMQSDVDYLILKQEGLI